MRTHRLAIKRKNRDHPIWVVEPGDFDCEPVGEIAPDEILKDPKFSVYCMDPENNSVLFVECDDPKAVENAPFYYQAQAEHAIGFVSMPMEVFHQVSNEICEPPKGLIFIHSVGRCGSTLVSKVLDGVSSVHSLSEPDDLTQLGNMRTSGRYTDAWLQKLIESSVKWRCKPRIGLPPDHVAIKTRSEVLVLADLIGASFPLSKHVFLYRDAVSWMASIFRGFPEDRPMYDEGNNRNMERDWMCTIPLLRDYVRPEAALNPVQIRILAWIMCMEGCQKLQEMGIPVCAARFEDITANSTEIMKQLLAFCEIEDANWNVIQEVLGRDSQAGTLFDREERRNKTREMTAELITDIHEMVATRPSLGKSSIVLPGTIQIS